MTVPKWEYSIQISSGARLYLGEDEPRYGLVWDLTRSNTSLGESPFRQAIVSSPEVFDDAEDAKQDAIVKLSKLSCPLERPIAHAVHWMLEDL